MIRRLPWWFYVEEHILLTKTKEERNARAGTYLGDERCKIGWLLKLEHSESNYRTNFKANSVASPRADIYIPLNTDVCMHGLVPALPV